MVLFGMAVVLALVVEVNGIDTVLVVGFWVVVAQGMGDVAVVLDLGVGSIVLVRVVSSVSVSSVGEVPSKIISVLSSAVVPAAQKCRYIDFNFNKFTNDENKRKTYRIHTMLDSPNSMT